MEMEMSEGWIERIKVAASDMIARVEAHLGSLGPLPGGKARQMAVTISGLDTPYQKTLFACYIAYRRPTWWVYADFDSAVFSITVEPDSRSTSPQFAPKVVSRFVKVMNAYPMHQGPFPGRNRESVPPSCEMPASSLAVNERLEKLFGGGA